MYRVDFFLFSQRKRSLHKFSNETDGIMNELKTIKRIVCLRMNKANKVRCVDRRTNALQTDQPTNQPTETASYRGALSHLKMRRKLWNREEKILKTVHRKFVPHKRVTFRLLMEEV